MGMLNPNMSKSYLNTTYLRAREDARGFMRKEERKGWRMAGGREEGAEK
jgi:hypothetical protein